MHSRAQHTRSNLGWIHHVRRKWEEIGIDWWEGDGVGEGDDEGRWNELVMIKILYNKAMLLNPRAMTPSLTNISRFSFRLLPIMRLSSSSFAGLVSLLCSRALAAPSPQLELEARDLTSFVASERAIALQGALNNIGPDGSEVPGAGAGFVVASPSKVNPDCKRLPSPCISKSRDACDLPSLT